MNGTYDTGTTETYEDEGGLDPREAARLLAQTQRQAQRELDFRSPWLSLLAAAAALVAFGAVWLSVRGQHPYKGPTAVGLVGPVRRRGDPDRLGALRPSPRQRRRQRALGAPAARRRSGLGGGVGRRVRGHGRAGERRGE